MSYKRHRATKSVVMKSIKTSSSGGTGAEQCLNKSAFPEIDGHIMNLVKSKGGYIRKVTPSPCGWYLTYELANYRQCYNIGRAHKSNNVKFVVDLKANKFCQTCHDTNCIDFRSNFWDLPDHCALPWQELFDDENETTISADEADAASAAATGKGEEQVDHQNSLWNSFANEKTRQ